MYKDIMNTAMHWPLRRLIISIKIGKMIINKPKKSSKKSLIILGIMNLRKYI